MTRVWLRLHHRGADYRWTDVTHRPAPTIITTGISDLGTAAAGGIVIDPSGADQPMTVTKPPYQVPTMAEIQGLECNGLDAVSTFSGCGGGCLGLEMAGYKIRWASEFIPAAADTYRANHPGVPLDTRDIRQVQPGEILDQLGLKPGELPFLEGSPPCAAFSTAGVRQAGWNKPRKYSDTVQRTDDLFGEYCRMIEGLRPAVFTAENVSGLVKGVGKGYFKEILARMKAAGYQVSARLLDASWLGVPQARQRVFFVGVRSDLGMAPVFPRPLPYQYSVRDALPHIWAQGDNGGFGGGGLVGSDRPAGSLGAGYSTGNGLAPPGMVVEGGDILTQRGPKQPLGRSPGDRPAPTVAAHGMGNAQEYQAAIVHDTSGQFSSGDVTDRPVPTITTGDNAMNSRHYQVRVIHDTNGQPQYSAGDITDQVAPTIMQRERSYQVTGTGVTHDPETGEDITIGRYAIGKEWQRLRAGEKSARFRDLTRPDVDQPVGTLTAGSGTGLLQSRADNGTHWAECRKLTLGELRALCSFPHDFQLTGSYKQRWERLGRAVPPVMMFHLAAAIRDQILLPLRADGRI